MKLLFLIRLGFKNWNSFWVVARWGRARALLLGLDQAKWLNSANWVWVLDRSKQLRPVWHHHVSLDQCDSSKIWSIQAQHCFQWKLKIMVVGVGQTEYSPDFLLMKLIWLVTTISGKFWIISRSRYYKSRSKFEAQLKLANDFQNVSRHDMFKNTKFSGEKYCEFSADSTRNARQIFSKMVMFGHLYLTFFKS